MVWLPAGGTRHVALQTRLPEGQVSQISVSVHEHQWKDLCLWVPGDLLCFTRDEGQVLGRDREGIGGLMGFILIDTDQKLLLLSAQHPNHSK